MAAIPPPNVIDGVLPLQWIQPNDPRFAGHSMRDGEIPFGPGFRKPMTPSQGTGEQCLAIPVWFVRRWLNRRYSRVIMRYQVEKLYEFKLVWHCENPHQCAFGKGWDEFVTENGLSAGDEITIMPSVYEDVFTIRF